MCRSGVGLVSAALLLLLSLVLPQTPGKTRCALGCPQSRFFLEKGMKSRGWKLLLRVSSPARCGSDGKFVI